MKNEEKNPQKNKSTQQENKTNKIAPSQSVRNNKKMRAHSKKKEWKISW